MLTPRVDFDHHSIRNLRIVHPGYVFRGLTYGEWVGVWLNQLMSDKPDVVYRGGKAMAFLRGNVEYASKDDPEHTIFSALTRESKLQIQEDTAVFIPVIRTMFVIDEEYQGQIMNDEVALRIREGETQLTAVSWEFELGNLLMKGQTTTNIS